MEVARNIVGIIGSIISFGIFFTPAPTLYGTIKKKAVEEVEAYMLPWTLLNSMIWIFYDLFSGEIEKLSVFFNNVIISSIELAYFDAYMRCAKDGKRWFVAGSIFFQIVLIVVLAIVAKHRTLLFFGIVADAFSITVYASHLAIWKRVVATKSVEFMHFWLSLVDLSSGICWTIYGLLQFDIFILVSSGVGAIFGAIQLGLYAYFYFHRNNKVTPTEEAIGGSAL